MEINDNNATERYRHIAQEAHDDAMMYRGKLEDAEARIAELEREVEAHATAEEVQIALREKVQEERDAALERIAELDVENGRHKRMFAAACETLGEIQQALGNSIVGIEPALVKELIEERDALAAHVIAIMDARDSKRGDTLKNMLAVLNGGPTPLDSLARRDALKQAEEVQHLIDDTLHWADGHVIANLHAELERLHQQAEVHQ